VAPHGTSGASLAGLLNRIGSRWPDLTDVGRSWRRPVALL